MRTRPDLRPLDPYLDLDDFPVSRGDLVPPDLTGEPQIRHDGHGTLWVVTGLLALGLLTVLVLLGG